MKRKVVMSMCYVDMDDDSDLNIFHGEVSFFKNGECKRVIVPLSLVESQDEAIGKDLRKIAHDTVDCLFNYCDKNISL